MIIWYYLILHWLFDLFELFDVYKLFDLFELFDLVLYCSLINSRVGPHQLLENDGDNPSGQWETQGRVTWKKTQDALEAALRECQDKDCKSMQRRPGPDSTDAGPDSTDATFAGLEKPCCFCLGAVAGCQHGKHLALWIFWHIRWLFDGYLNQIIRIK